MVTLRDKRLSKTPEEQSLEEYRRIVTRIAETGTPSEEIINRHPDHASIIIELLFRQAVRSVRILTGKLDKRVYSSPSLVSAIVDFLAESAENKIHILIEDDMELKNHPIIVESTRGGVLAQISIALVPNEVQANYNYHFMVVDSLSYRFEECRKHLRAVVQFREPRFSGLLEEKFAALWNEVTKFDVVE